MKLFWKTSAVTEGNNCLFERNVVIKIERAWTIGKKLPQDAINPAHGSLLRVNSPSHFIFWISEPLPRLISCNFPRAYRLVQIIIWKLYRQKGKGNGKWRCSGSYCQAVVFLVIKHDSISERPGYWQWGSRYTAHAGPLWTVPTRAGSHFLIVFHLLNSYSLHGLTCMVFIVFNCFSFFLSFITSSLHCLYFHNLLADECSRQRLFVIAPARVLLFPFLGLYSSCLNLCVLVLHSFSSSRLVIITLWNLFFIIFHV